MFLNPRFPILGKGEERVSERLSVMNHITLSKYAALLFAIFVLSGCTGPVIVGGSAAMIVATNRGSGGAADTEHQIPEHQSWCYNTLGYVECYAHPQKDIAYERLVNVDPQNLYPVDLQAYQAALDKDKAASAAPTNLIVQSTLSPVTVSPVPPMGVQPVEPVVQRTLDPIVQKQPVAAAKKAPSVVPAPQAKASDPLPSPTAPADNAKQSIAASPPSDDKDTIPEDPADTLKAE